jgi:hypothetical protein
MKHLRDGLVAGLFAGLVLAVLYFGPGNALHNPASWLGLDSANAGKYVGFVLWVLLGGLFGLAFGALQRREPPPVERSLLLGVAVGLLFWLVIRVLFGVLLNHVTLDLGGFLFSIVTCLLYGMILGTFSFQRVDIKTA